MICYALKNVAAQATAVVEEPWNHPKRNQYPTLLVAKEQWKTWISDPTTDHCFLSAVEGVSSAVRISESNQAFKIHGMFADYDADFSEEDRIKLFKSKVEWFPAYSATTFQGRGRLLFIFEKPILVSGNKHYEAFAKELITKLKLTTLLKGFDEPAFLTPAKYYDIGRTWTEVYKDARIPSQFLNLWMAKAGNKIRFAPQELKIPLNVIQEEIDKRWPGGWIGAFEEGAQSVRFWDPSADNVTGAVLRTHGFQCFTGPVPFMSWRDLLGSSFCQQYEASRSGAIIEQSVFDQFKKEFWYNRTDTGRWDCMGGEEYARLLRVAGFDSRVEKGKTTSELDALITTVQTQRRVDCSVKFVYVPEGIITWNGDTCLNTCRVRCLTPIGELAMPPEPTFDDLKEKAPFIHAFLDHIFDGQDEQLWSFLGWIKHAYVGGVRMKPTRGHAVVLAGPPAMGKTFLIQAILSPLFGGRAKAGSYFLGTSRWTSELTSSPLVFIDDEVTGTDQKAIHDMTTKIKEFVACGEIVCATKYGAEKTAPFNGRPVIVTNIDPHSMARCMPDMSLSTMDKFMLFKTTDKVFPLFTEQERHHEILSEELPYFAQWLIDWKIPEELIDKKNLRFGLRAYHHPTLLAESRKQGNDEIIWSLIVRMVTESCRENRKQNKDASDELRWRGDVTRLYGDLHATAPHIMRDYKIRSIQLTLQSLERKGSRDIKRITEGGVELWDINCGR
jgi:hypothetical protein